MSCECAYNVRHVFVLSSQLENCCVNFRFRGRQEFAQHFQTDGKADATTN